jgi:benzoate 4-monooxygenase
LILTTMFIGLTLDWTFPLVVVTLVVLVHVVPWLVDLHGIRDIPGPLLAKYSDAWLGWVSAHGHRSEVVHEMHQKYGKQ